MNLTDWIKSTKAAYGPGVYEVSHSHCCKAPLQIYLDTAKGQMIVCCSKCEQPRMVFGANGSKEALNKIQ